MRIKSNLISCESNKQALSDFYNLYLNTDKTYNAGGACIMTYGQGTFEFTENQISFKKDQNSIEDEPCLNSNSCLVENRIGFKLQKKT